MEKLKITSDGLRAASDRTLLAPNKQENNATNKQYRHRKYNQAHNDKH
jgi:hypothetical protein